MFSPSHYSPARLRGGYRQTVTATFSTARRAACRIFLWIRRSGSARAFHATLKRIVAGRGEVSRSLRADYIPPIVRYRPCGIERPITRCLLSPSVCDSSPVARKSAEGPSCRSLPPSRPRNVRGGLRANLARVSRRADFCARRANARPVEIRKRDSHPVVARHEDSARMYRRYLARP